MSCLFDLGSSALIFSRSLRKSRDKRRHSSESSPRRRSAAVVLEVVFVAADSSVAVASNLSLRNPMRLFSVVEPAADP